MGGSRLGDSKMSKFYVKAETAKGNIIAYGVLDCVNGMESEHGRFTIKDHGENAIKLANELRHDMNTIHKK